MGFLNVHTCMYVCLQSLVSSLIVKHSALLYQWLYGVSNNKCFNITAIIVHDFAMVANGVSRVNFVSVRSQDDIYIYIYI